MDLLMPLLVLLPAAVTALFAMRLLRVVRIVRVLRRPELLGRVFSPDVRRRLEAAGLDPDGLEPGMLRSLERDPELYQQVHDELRTAFARMLRGRSGGPSMYPAGPSAAPGFAPAVGHPIDALPLGTRPGDGGSRPEAWTRPDAFDRAGEDGGQRWRWRLLVAALVACGAVLLQR